MIDFHPQRPRLSPEMYLWLACLRDAVEELRDIRFGNNTPAKCAARDFIFGDHIGFIGLCDAFGYTPDAMRKRVRRALQKGTTTREDASERDFLLFEGDTT